MAVYICGEKQKRMTTEQKQKLAGLEKQILGKITEVGGHRYFRPLIEWTKELKNEMKSLFSQRRSLLNKMFECNPEEVEQFRKVNERLADLTGKMHAKALSLYEGILKEGYDPEFDDDIMLEATLRYVYNDEWDSVIADCVEENLYGSRFAEMLDILTDYYDSGGSPECAFCQTSYDLRHKVGMPASEFGLDNFLDDGESWNDPPLDRKEFEGICICHAVHDLCGNKLYSIPDLLRMNDFWVEIKVTHQHIVDRAGKRCSSIEQSEED